MSSIRPNRLQARLARLESLPRFLAAALRQWLFRRAIPFVGTARLDVLHVDADRVELALANRRRVRNHIGGVHAAAAALLAETASGLALGVHLPDDRLPLLKSMHVRYLRRAQGGLRAVAALDAAQVRTLHEQEKGEATVRVQVTDAAGEQPVEAEMTWAWIPRQRR